MESYKITEDATVRTIHLDKGVVIVEANEFSAINFMYCFIIIPMDGEPLAQVVDVEVAFLAGGPDF